jgi:PhoH-like ATPase
MGEGVKSICLGDIHQVDNPYLNQENNGLNWVVKKFKGSNIYSYIASIQKKLQTTLSPLKFWAEKLSKNK